MRGHVVITKADGSTIDLDAHSIRITPLEEPMTDTPSPRPTKAGMALLEGELAAEKNRARRLEERLTEVTQERDDWRAAKIKDPEAEALSGCVRAIDAMNTAARQGRSDFAMPMQSYPVSAGDTPVGRILLSLAARYHIPLVPPPPPEEDPDEFVTVTIPRRVAHSVGAM